MMNQPCVASLLLLASTTLFSIQPAVAEERTASRTDASTPLGNNVTGQGAIAPPISPTKLAKAEPVEITNVQLEATADGFTLRLETTGELASPETSVTGNVAIANIPNAVLKLSDGDEFSASDPVDGIALVNITNSSADQVRIVISGHDAPPQVDISATAGEVIANVTLGTPSAQGEGDAIQIGVTGEQDDYFVPSTSTATRTNTPILDTPVSIQVVPRQVLDDQQVIRLDEALANVSGVSRGGTFSNLTLEIGRASCRERV